MNILGKTKIAANTGNACLLLAFCCLLPAAARAAGSKSSGTIEITDDLTFGSAGGVDSAGGNFKLSGTLGQVSAGTMSYLSTDIESGYFSKHVSSPSYSAFQNVYTTSLTVTGLDAIPSNPQGALYISEVSTATDLTGTIISGSSVTWPILVTGLAGNTTYYGRVRANYMNGDESIWVTLGSTETLDIVPPDAAVDLAGLVKSTESVVLSWTATGDDGPGGILDNSTFTVQYSTYTPIVWSTQTAQVNISTTGVNPETSRYYAVTGLWPNTTYYFRLWTKDDAGNWSALSNGATAATLANPVTGAQVTSVYSSSVAVNWTPLPASPSSSTCEGYLVNASTAPDFSGVVLSSFSLQPSASSLSVVGLHAGNTYYFRVGSLNWPGTANYASAGSTKTLVQYLSPDCPLALTVRKNGTEDHTSLQIALDALPHNLTGNACVVVKDTETYAEQVTVQGFTTNGYRLKIMSDPTFVSSAPVVNPPVASIAAFRIMNDSVTMQGINVIPTNPVAYGILASSANITISSVNVVGVTNINTAGIAISSWSTVSYSSITVQAADGLRLTGSNSTVSFSTMTSTNVGPTGAALYISGVSSNTITKSRIANLATAGCATGWVGAGAHLTNGASYNTISQSTITTSVAGFCSGAVQLTNGASYNTITQSYVDNQSNGYGIRLAMGRTDNQSGLSVDFNTISMSTITGNGPEGVTPEMTSIYLEGASSNTFTQNHILNRGAGHAVLIRAGSYLPDPSGPTTYNTFSQSTITTNCANCIAFGIIEGSGNIVTQSYLYNPSGDGMHIYSDSNTVSWSAITTNGGGDAAGALYITGSFNSVISNILSAPNGTGLWLGDGTVTHSSNTISFSTITSNGVGRAALYVTRAASIKISDSYIQGSTAAYITGSTNTVINSSVLIATNTTGNALWLLGGSVNLSLSTNTLSGGSQGAGVYLDKNNSGTINLSSNTISGGKYGVNIATQAAGAALSISSMTFGSLTAGATAVNFTGGMFVSTFTAMRFDSPNIGTNINASALSPGSSIYILNPAGSKAAQALAYDPLGYVQWPWPGVPSIFAVYAASITVAYGTNGALGYAVEAALASNFLSAVSSSSAFSLQLSALSPDGLSPDTTYYLRAGALWDQSTYYNAVILSTSTLAQPPINPSVSGIYLTSAAVQWSAVTSQGYVVDASSASDFSGVVLSSFSLQPSAFSLSVPDLFANTTYYFRVGSLNHNGVANYASAGSSITLANQVAGVQVTSVYISSVAVSWTPLPASPSSSTCEGYIVNASSTNFAGGIVRSSSTLSPLPSALSVSGLLSNVTYYFRVGSLNWEGKANFAATIVSTKTLPEMTPPTMVSFESPDYAWYRQNVRYYNVDFADTGGSLLSEFRVKATTGANETGTLVAPWTAVFVNISSDSYTTNWQLPSGFWDMLLEGVTNYISVKVFDGALNSSTTVDAFLVFKDTTPPSILGSAGDNVWRNSSGTVYDLDFFDYVSKLSTAQYTAWTSTDQTNIQVLGWTTLFSNLVSISYTSNWGLSSGEWNLLQPGTNYITVRSWDVAGTTNTWVDAFYILKDTSAPNPITTLSASPVSTGAVKISFNAPAEYPSGIGEFAIQYASYSVVWSTSSVMDSTNVYVSTAGPAAGSAQTINIGGLSGNTTYYFRTWSKDLALNWSGLSNGGTVATLANPVTGSQLNLFVSSVAVNWTALPVSPSSATCEGYLVDASTAPDFSGVLYSSFSLQPSAFSLSVSDLEGDTTYYFRVGSLNWSNTPNYTLAGSTMTPDTIPPGMATGIIAYQSGAANSIKISWAAPGDNIYQKNLPVESEFRIQWSTSPPETVIWSTANAQVVIPTGPVNVGLTVSTVVVNLPAEKTAYFRVWTADEKQNWSPQSALAAASVSPFSFVTLAGAGYVGQPISLALDGAGNSHISYNDSVNSDLKYARCTGSACSIETVDNGDVGGGDIALDVSGKPHISYFAANGQLKYASWTGTSWSTQTVPSETNPGSGQSSLALDALGNPHISYEDVNNLDLKYAKWTGTFWSTQTVDTAGNVGKDASLALDGAGNPCISYFDLTNGDLKYAHWVGTSWDIQTIDSAGNVGGFTSIALDGAGNPRMSYYDWDNLTLKYARWTGTFWNIQTVDSAGVPGDSYTSLALDGVGNPGISYLYSGSGDLKYARWTGTSWSTQTVDSEGAGSGKLALDGTGSPYIAYFDAANNGLKYAYWAGAGFAPPMGGNARGKVQAPDNMNAGLQGSTSIQWLWQDHASNELGFRVYYSSYGSANNGFTLAAGTTTLLADATYWFQTGLTPNTSYQAYVAAVNAGGVVVSSAALAYTWAAPPQNSRFDGVYVSSATLAWNYGTNNPPWTNYEAEVSSGPGFGTFVSSYADTGNAFQAAGLTPNVTYYLRVRAVSSQGVPTAYTDAVSTITRPAVPVAVGFSSVTYSSFTVNWSANGNSPNTRYIVQSAADPGFTVGILSTVTYSNQYTFGGLSASTTYFARLKARGIMGAETAFVAFGSTITTAMYPSSAPLSSVSSTSVRANWGYNGNADGTQYLAQVSTDNFETILQSSLTSSSTLTFSSLAPNTTHYFRAAAVNASGALSQYTGLGSTITYAAPALKHASTFPSVGGFVVLFQWLPNGNPAYTEYYAEVSTANNFSGTAVFPAQWFTGVSTQAVNLNPLTGYYFRVKSRNISGTETEYLNLGSTTTIAGVDISSPVIVDNQAGDDVWRSSNSGIYNIDFTDYGGSFLKQVEIKVTTGIAQTGTLISNWAPVLTNINSSSYTVNFSLQPSAFSLLAPGTNYISVRAFDNAGNYTDMADAFYVLKDTAAPVITDNQTGEDVWRQTDPGPIYNIDFTDSGSGLDTIEYSASNSANSADAAVIGWTAIALLTGGATAYTDNWGVNFAGLVSGATNYISVRARDKAGNIETTADVFKALKNINGPEVKITMPYAGYQSALGTVSGTAKQVLDYPITGVELTLQNKISTLYWKDSDFISVAPAWFIASGTAVWSYNAAAISWQNGITYELVARSSDTAGNYSASYATAAFIFDNSVPSAGFTWPGAAVSSLNYVSGTALDPAPNSGIVSSELRLGRISDGKWWNFFSRSWSDIAVSTIVTGGAGWNYYPDLYLKGNLASNASYYLTVAPKDGAAPSNAPSFGVYGSTFTFVDVSSPATVSVVSASSGTAPGEMLLQWTAAGDDGTDGLMLNGWFAVKYSTWPGAVFSTQTAQVLVSTANIIPGSTRNLLIQGLAPSVTYYLKVWTGDDAGLWSAASSSVSAISAAALNERISGHVRNPMSQGITGVLVEAINGFGLTAGSAYTVDDGSGTFTVSGLADGFYRIQATWTANDFASSISKDLIPMGYAEADFELSVSYQLASVSGQLLGIRGGNAKAEGLRPKAEGAGVYVELYQGGRRIATADVNETGRFMITNLLPGKYTVKMIGLAEGAKEVNVRLSEGQNLEISPLGTLLKKNLVYAFPNPASNRVVFHVESDITPLKKHIIVFGVDGRVVREFSDSDGGWTSPGAGKHELTWNIDGKVASGVYIYEVKVKDESTGDTAKTIKKLAIIK